MKDEEERETGECKLNVKSNVSNVKSKTFITQKLVGRKITALPEGALSSFLYRKFKLAMLSGVKTKWREVECAEVL